MHKFSSQAMFGGIDEAHCCLIVILAFPAEAQAVKSCLNIANRQLYNLSQNQPYFAPCFAIFLQTPEFAPRPNALVQFSSRLDHRLKRD